MFKGLDLSMYEVKELVMNPTPATHTATTSNITNMMTQLDNGSNHDTRIIW